MTEDELDDTMMEYTKEMVSIALFTLNKIAKVNGTAEDYQRWSQNALMTISAIEQNARQVIAEFEASNK